MLLRNPLLAEIPPVKGKEKGVEEKDDGKMC